MRLFSEELNRKSNIKFILAFSLIIILMLSPNFICQVKTNQKDSLKIYNSTLFDQPITLQSIDHLQIPIGFYSNFNTYPELEFLELSQDLSNNSPPDFKLIQNDLLKNFRQSMQWKENYKLGVFGKYLGYAVGAAAVGLGAASIAKYGKDYFTSKKKKQK